MNAGRGSGSQARLQVEARRAQSLIFEGGTLRNSPGFFFDSSFGNKASFSILCEAPLRSLIWTFVSCSEEENTGGF